MKTTTRSIAITAGLAAMLSASALRADPGDTVANIPFDFQAAGKTLPAGKYAVIRNEMSSITMIRNSTSGHAVIMLTSPMQCGGGSESKLVFYRQDEGYKLSELWFAGAACSYGPLGTKGDRASRERGVAATVRLLQK